MTAEELIEMASKLVGVFTPSESCEAGSVAAALVTASGNVYTGVCVDAPCSLGFCAEHAAIANMLKAHESNIRMIVAIYLDGAIMTPCGRCRELMWQVSNANRTTQVIVGPGHTVMLQDLLPHAFSK